MCLRNMIRASFSVVHVLSMLLPSCCCCSTPLLYVSTAKNGVSIVNGLLRLLIPGAHAFYFEGVGVAVLFIESVNCYLKQGIT